MAKIEKTITYFEEAGARNTYDVIKAVSERLKEGDINTIVVASTSGSTGKKFAKFFRSKVNVVIISYKTMNTSYKKEIISFGGKIAENTRLRFHAGRHPAKGFYALGQGFKVAIEVMLIATEKRLLKPYTYIISVGGTCKGADTAIVVRATTLKEIFCRDATRKLEIREIIALPLVKKWW
jgi:hypothetical protein